jgi:hypothetical protein
MDESGTHGDQSPVVTVGLYVGKPSAWQRWTKHWNAQKRKVPTGRNQVKVYHAVDCANRQGEFSGWQRDERDSYVAQLIPIIGQHDVMGITVGIHMPSFLAAMNGRPELREMFGDPYSACFQWAVQTLLNMMDERGDRQSVAFIHEVNPFKREAEAAFAYVNDVHVLGRRKVSLTFGTKEEYVPLQAADILAYESNHLLRDPSKAERIPWKLLNPGADVDEEKRRIRVLHYGQNNMHQLIDLLSAYRAKLLASGWDGQVT